MGLEIKLRIEFECFYDAFVSFTGSASFSQRVIKVLSTARKLELENSDASIFSKTGGYQQALKDFDSLNLSDVRDLERNGVSFSKDPHQPGLPVCKTRFRYALRKHAYSNILKILQSKKGKFSDKKNSDVFHISAQNIDCGYSLEPPRRGGSNEYPQSMFISKIRKLMYTPVNPSFTI